MTFEQIADKITTNNTRVLGSEVDCDVSARLRMSFFMSSFYTYGLLSSLLCLQINTFPHYSTINQPFVCFKTNIHILFSALFCWYKVAIVTIQSPEQPRLLPKIQRSKRKKKKFRNKCLNIIIRKDHIFLDLLWYYIHILYIISMTMGNFTSDPSHNKDEECSHGDHPYSLLAYIIAVFIEFVALIIVFVTPLYQLMKTKKRLFRNVFSNIKIKRGRSKRKKSLKHVKSIDKHKNSNGYSESILLPTQSSTDSVNSPAQQEFISRIKGTICRNFIAGFISILLFSAFMTMYTWDVIADSNTFFDSGIGYVISFTCYLLNYLCLTFSYQNHWPMLLPIICKPPWSKFKYGGAKISLQQSQTKDNYMAHITPLKLNEDNDFGDDLRQKVSSSAIPIIKATGNNKGNGSFESLLASSHLSTTPKYHTLNMNDNARMQRQYEEYLKKQQLMAGTKQKEHYLDSTSSSHPDIKSNGDDGKGHRDRESMSETRNDSNDRNVRRMLTPSSAQEQYNKKYSESLPEPKLKDKQYFERYDQNEDRLNDEEESDGSSSEDYDSEGIDSIKLRVGSYDAVSYRFSSIGYHDDDNA